MVYSPEYILDIVPSVAHVTVSRRHKHSVPTFLAILNPVRSSPIVGDGITHDDTPRSLFGILAKDILMPRLPVVRTRLTALRHRNHGALRSFRHTQKLTQKCFMMPGQNDHAIIVRVNPFGRCLRCADTFVERHQMQVFDFVLELVVRLLCRLIRFRHLSTGQCLHLVLIKSGMLHDHNRSGMLRTNGAHRFDGSTRFLFDCKFTEIRIAIQQIGRSVYFVNILKHLRFELSVTRKTEIHDRPIEFTSKDICPCIARSRGACALCN